MPTAVSNASPLIHLAAVGQFALLRALFIEVWISPAVWREVVEQGHGRWGAREVERAIAEGWLRVRPLDQSSLAAALWRDLHDGEAETIALAVQERPDVVLLDEFEARRAAAVQGLTRTGVVGILLRAKREGKIPFVRESLDRLRTEAGFWIDDFLYLTALAAAEEAREGM